MLLPGAINLPSNLNPNLMWTVSIFHDFSFKSTFIFCIFLGILFSGLAGLFPLVWSFRTLAFLFLLLSDSFQNSTGARTHIYQFWLWSSFFMCLIPGNISPWQKTQENRLYKMQLITGLWGATSIVLIFYFFSGSWKLIGIIQQIINNEPNLISQDGLIYHIASEIIRAGAQPIAFNFLDENRYLNPFLGIGVVMIQLFTVTGIFKGRLLPLIGTTLIFFHVSTFLILSITYPPNVYLVSLLFCASPLKHDIKLIKLKRRFGLFVNIFNRVIGINLKLNRKQF